MKISLTTLAALTVLLTTAIPAFAESDRTHYSIAFISDAAQGRNLSREKYETAIERLQDSSAKGIHGFLAANNLCVAYVKTGAFVEAEDTCSKAVDRIESIRESDKRSKYQTVIGNDYNSLHAIALSNRGVLYALKDEIQLAHEAFNTALLIDSDVREPEINLAHLAVIAETQPQP